MCISYPEEFVHLFICNIYIVFTNTLSQMTMYALGKLAFQNDKDLNKKSVSFMHIQPQ